MLTVVRIRELKRPTYWIAGHCDDCRQPIEHLLIVELHRPNHVLRCDNYRCRRAYNTNEVINQRRTQ